MTYRHLIDKTYHVNPEIVCIEYLTALQTTQKVGVKRPNYCLTYFSCFVSSSRQHFEIPQEARVNGKLYGIRTFDCTRLVLYVIRQTY
jgi:hypothetical protein